MRAYQSKPTTLRRTRLLIGTMLILLSVAWLIGQPPTTAHAAGVPFCGKLVAEQTPTRPASLLDRSVGPVGTNMTVTTSGWNPGAHVTLNVDGRSPKTGDLYILMPNFANGVVASDGTVKLGTLDAPYFFCMDMYSNPNIEYHLGDAGNTAYFVLTAEDGEVSTPVAFQYLAAPTVSLNASQQGVAVGSTVVVSGAGWEPQAAITFSLTSIGISTQRVSNGAPVQTTADSQGAFQVHYPIPTDWPWHSNSRILVNGSGPRFGLLQSGWDLNVLPAVAPTFRVDHTLVTPGMTVTVSGDHWYPGDTYTIKYCDAELQDSGWANGPNCGKAVNPALGTVTIDANGRMRQQFTIPKDLPLGVVMVRVQEASTPPVAVHVVDHLPTWDDVHPRVAALRNGVVNSLPFTIPGALLLGALGVFGVRRRRARQVGG